MVDKKSKKAKEKTRTPAPVYQRINADIEAKAAAFVETCKLNKKVAEVAIELADAKEVVKEVSKRYQGAVEDLQKTIFDYGRELPLFSEG